MDQQNSQDSNDLRIVPNDTRLSTTTNTTGATLNTSRSDPSIELHSNFPFPTHATAENSSPRETNLFKVNSSHHQRHWRRREYCPRKTQLYLRMRPYRIPERFRTRSENADPTSQSHIDTITMIDEINSRASLITPSMLMDTGCGGSVAAAAMEVSTSSNCNNNMSGFLSVSSSVLVTRVKVLKKSKSLENLRTENLDGSQPSHEMEFVSSRIQKLKVDE